MHKHSLESFDRSLHYPSRSVYQRPYLSFRKEKKPRKACEDCFLMFVCGRNCDWLSCVNKARRTDEENHLLTCLDRSTFLHSILIIKVDGQL